MEDVYAPRLLFSGARTKKGAWEDMRNKSEKAENADDVRQFLGDMG